MEKAETEELNRLYKIAFVSALSLVICEGWLYGMMIEVDVREGDPKLWRDALSIALVMWVTFSVVFKSLREWNLWRHKNYVEDVPK
jgi:hypothetical protein